MDDSPRGPSAALDRIAIPGTILRWEHILWAALIGLAILTRFAMLDTRVMSHDEAQHTQLAWFLHSGAGYQHYPMTHGPFQIELVAMVYSLLGGSDWSSRIPAAAFGVAAVAMLWLFRRWLGRGGALAAALLLTISPFMMYYTRYVRNETFVVVWALLMFYAIGRYVESRQDRWLYLLVIVTTLHYATKETAYIYIGLMIVFLLAWLIWDFQRRLDLPPEVKQRFLALLGAGIAVGVLAVVILLAGRSEIIQAAQDAGVVAEPDRMLHTEMPITNGLILVGLGVLLAAVGLAAAGVSTLVRSKPLEQIRCQFPAVDALIILGVLMLPQLSAFPMALFNLNPWDGDPLVRMQDAGYLLAAAVCFLPGLLTAIAIGLAWDWKRFLVSGGIFLGLFTILYTTFFTNLPGWATGMIGNVNYWMAQQDVERGSQPWYYYLLIQIPMYEYLPAALTLCAGGIGLRAMWTRFHKPAEKDQTEEIPEASAGHPATLATVECRFPLLALLGFWSIGSFLAFTAAGEKMPWLTVHITLPFILLGGWVLGRTAGGIRESRFFSWPGLLGTLAIPAAITAFLAGLGVWNRAAPPFSGTTLEAISSSSSFIFSMVIFLGGIFLAGWAWRGIRAGAAARMVFLGGAMLLAVCTFRAAWMASFLHYDLATEFLVYAHSAPGVKTVLRQLEDASRRTQDSMEMPVAYDEHVGWIMTWYLRDFPNAQNIGNTLSRKLVDIPAVLVSGSHFQDADQLLNETHDSYDYIRGWWPTMDYFHLTGGRILDALENPQYRNGLWDIWWSRDYTAYGLASGTDFSLARWPVSESMRMYLRKDLSGSVWPHHSTGILPAPAADPYTETFQMLMAEQIWGQAGAEPGWFNLPRAIAAAPDGSVYVSDTNNNRVQHFGSDGEFLGAWGSASPAGGDGTFNEPWGIAVGPDGSVYVADTWNNRIQKFAADGRFLAAWGHGGGSDDMYGFYGPRGVAVDAQGRVFVSDTGNKRVLVFNADGGFLMSIGEGGFAPGQFDEPVGLAVGPDGRLYVADAWNRRIQVFEETGNGFFYQSEWAIDGWAGDSPEIKPYLAVAQDGTVWVTDPESARILGFDAFGKIWINFGQSGDDDSSFHLPTGIAAGADGGIFIADTGNNRVMVFHP